MNDIIDISVYYFKNHTVYGVKGTGEKYKRFFEVVNKFKFEFLPDGPSFWAYLLFENDENHERFKNDDFIKSLEMIDLTSEIDDRKNQDISSTELLDFNKSYWM
jgi:hypothetical protein